MAIKGP